VKRHQELTPVAADGKLRDMTESDRLAFLVVGGSGTVFGLSLLAITYGTRRNQRKAARL
jgi:cellobiose-specific phosphotransferase system component IIC